MINNIRTFQLLRCVCILIAITLYGLSTACAASEKSRSTNPAYASYDFGDRSKVVVLGSQPLGVLHSVVPEIMKRDQILKKVLKSQKLELLVLPFYSGPDINHFMREGKIDISMAGDFPTLTMASTTDVEIVAIVKRDRASVVSHTQYTTLMDLKGKRIGFPAGTSSHLGLLVVLEASGLKESDVRMIPMDIDLLTSALVNDKIDAFAGWEPIPASAIANNKNLKRIAQFLNTDFIYWRGTFAKEKPKAARHMLAAYIRALNWLNNSETHLTQGAQWSLAGTEAFLGQHSKLSLVQFKQQIRKNLNLIGSAAIPSAEFADNSYFNRAFNLLQQKGLLPQEGKWALVQQALHPNLIQEILAEPETYKTKVFDYSLD